MKKHLFLFAAFLSVIVPSLAQDFQGKAIYETKVTKAPNFGGRDMPEARKKEIMDRMKTAMEKTYILTFDRTSSYYEEDEKLEAPSSNNGRGFGFGLFSQDIGKYYKNIKDETYTKQVESYSKLFLIKDKMEKPDWKMGAETKKIGNYTCYMATLTTPIDTTGASVLRGFGRGRGGQSGEAPKIPTEKTVTAWYTLDIPISQGPAQYWGLPGLILEVEEENSTLVCSKIIMNAKDIVEVEAPKKGKEINQADYDVMMAKKQKEMMENFQQRGGGRDGRGGGRGF